MSDVSESMAAEAKSADKGTTRGIAVDPSLSLIERIDRPEQERKALGSDLNDIHAQA